MKDEAVSIRAVAERAGVSKMTVSRVIRGESSVKEETRKRVVSVMEELGYVPSLLAQSLRSKDPLRSAGSRLIAVIFGSGTETAVEFFHNVMAGIEQSAAGFGLCPVQIHWQDSIEESWPRLQNLFSVENVGGALLVGQFELRDIDMIGQRVENLVVVDGPAPQIGGIGSVESDYFEGAVLGLSHLIETGARRIVIFTVQKGHYFANAMELAAKAKGAECSEICVINDCLSTQDAYESTKRFVTNGTDFNGVFTTDEFAIGVVKALHELNIGIPDQVKIVGFDDTHYASFLTPTLTSIRIDKFQLGIEAVETLVSIIRTSKGGDGIKKVIRPSLIRRESTG